MPMCPNGHQSDTSDWCEVCGMRIAAPASTYGTRPPSSAASSSASPVSAPPGGPGPTGPPGFEAEPAAGAERCPNCGTAREGAALFCEECRFNFRTHTATVEPPPTAPGFPPYQRYGSQLSRPSQVNRPAEPLPSESVTVTSGSGDFLLDPPSNSVRSGLSPAATPPAEAPPESPQQPSPARSVSPGPPAPSSTADPTTAVAAPSPEAGRVPAAAGLGTAWVAVVRADRAYFTAMMTRSGPDAESLYFPAFSPEVELPLIGNQITIGRRRHSTGKAPDIDLSRAPEDPGVSHQHAVLVQQPDGNWSVVDQDSTNGTTVNLGEDPIRPYTPVPLAEGDRVHVGAWTTITIRRA
jgi:FHA domain